MKRIIVTSLLALAWAAGRDPAIEATEFPKAPPSQESDRIHLVASSDVIVIGKATAHEAKTASLRLSPNSEAKGEWCFGTVKVTKVLLGTRALTEIRVGMPLNFSMVRDNPKDPKSPSHKVLQDSKKALNYSLPLKKEKLYFLNKHFEGDFYRPSPYNFLDVYPNKSKAARDKDLAAIKQLVKLLENPEKGLKDRVQYNRLRTAALLIYRYRSVKSGNMTGAKTEPIDAEESKLIMSALAEANWFPKYGPATISPRLLFMAMGVTEADGYKPPPRTINDLGPGLGETKEYARKATLAAQKWVKENRTKYRIKRFVENKKAEKQ
jgi:hypothetical protein